MRSCSWSRWTKPRRCGAGARRRVDGHAELLEPLLGTAAFLVLPQRGEELGAARELGELDRGDRAAAADVLPPLGRVHDLAGPWHVRHARELDPFDMADDGDAGHRWIYALSGAAANSRMPASKSSVALKPSRSAAF